MFLYVIDIYSKYAWFVPLKDKKGITVTKKFKKFYMNQVGNQIKYGSMKSWLRYDDIEMYSTRNEGKSVVVVVEKFIRTLKSKIYKYMTSISKNVYID